MNHFEPTSSAPAIELKGVGFSIGGETLLREAHLAVGRGEILVLMGPSGEGKSLLLKIIAGLLEPTDGEVRIEGRARVEMTASERKALGRQMGMLFQRGALFDSLNSLENVSFPQMETLGRSQVESDAFSRKLLEAVGLESAAERYPSEISGGMQKRLGIARALSLTPRYILYDDPTAGLDPITSRKIIRLIKDLQERDGSTVVLVTNEIGRAFQIADQMAFVFDGKLVCTGSVEETRASRDARVAAFLRGRGES
ncbi:MAG: ATP-binding cassette domain-containing protein [Bdellovibrionales bacterium]|jgi:phospholipid/cholesterol/gamma-HCH transport system ATP-binding protein|nr:ATP-binding cassette domain-containing protein [Bdellovibrionales bacterium]